jgi:hypothetical protein
VSRGADEYLILLLVKRIGNDIHVAKALTSKEGRQNDHRDQKE